MDQPAEAARIAGDRLRRIPNDAAALRALQSLAVAQGQLEKAEEYGRRLLASGTATSIDMNNIAWNALVRNSVTAETIRLAQQAVQMEQSSNPTTLHTLASLLAENGETAPARDLLLRSIELSGNEEPDGDDWYILGRIAEQIGVNEAAVAAYNKVEKPKEQYAVPDSTYTLAQRRLALMMK